MQFCVVAKVRIPSNWQAKFLESKKQMAFYPVYDTIIAKIGSTTFFLITHQSILLLPLPLLHGDRLLLFDPPHKSDTSNFRKYGKRKGRPSGEERYNSGGGGREE